MNRVLTRSKVASVLIYSKIGSWDALIKHLNPQTYFELLVKSCQFQEIPQLQATTCFKLRATCFKLQAIYFKLRAIYFKLRATYFKLQAICFKL